VQEHDQPASGESARRGSGLSSRTRPGVDLPGGVLPGRDLPGGERTGDDLPDSDLFDPDEMRELSGYARLAARLKEAHEVLCGMDLDLPDRADFVRRLLVITAASRHDRKDALERVERFLATVDQKRAGLGKATPNIENIATQG
jgi:hypothetical protein